jgi:hypothetical protein
MLNFSRFVSGAFAVLFLLFAWLTYVNVWSPLAPFQAAAERAACGVKDCKKQHGATKVDRVPFGVTFEYTWESGKVIVSCQRARYVYGHIECTTEW